MRTEPMVATLGVALFVLGAWMPGALAAARTGAFVGGGIGGGSANLAGELCDDFFGCLNDFVDEDVLVLEAHGGYRFNSYFALEGRVLGAANDGDDDIEELSFGAVSARAVGLIPLGSIMELYAMLGIYTGESDVSLLGSENESGLVYGGGVQMNFGASGQFGVRVEYEMYDADELLDDLHSFTASFQYNFF